jgi:Uma2 family endonuclease
MGTKAALPVAEYLRTTFPGLDKEYWEGELLERSLPDWLHGRTQLLIGAFFLALGKTLSLWPSVETRVRIREDVFLIPDVAVFQGAKPELVPETPPLIAIEVLSPDDKLAKVREKLEEYRAWGVPHVWLVDPHSKRLYTCDAGLIEVPTLRIPELSIEVTPADIFE